MAASKPSVEEILPKVKSKSGKPALSREQQRQFIEEVTPKLRFLARCIEMHRPEPTVGKTREALTKLDGQIEKVVGTIRDLDWATMWILLHGIEFHDDHELGKIYFSPSEGKPSFRVAGDPLSELLDDFRNRVQTLAESLRGAKRGISIDDDLKKIYLPQFVDAICQAWPGKVVTTVNPTKKTFVSVVEKLIEDHTGWEIDGKTHVSRWLKPPQKQ